MAVLQGWLTPRRGGRSTATTSCRRCRRATCDDGAVDGVRPAAGGARPGLAEAGLGFRVLWWVTRGGFARREARVFGGA